MKLDPKKIRIYMAKSCMNTKDLAAVSGIPRPTLDSALSGKGALPATIGKIAKTLNAPISEILQEE